MTAMKWWGWGREDVAFTDEDKPALAPFLREHLDLDPRAPAIRPSFGALDVFSGVGFELRHITPFAQNTHRIPAVGDAVDEHLWNKRRAGHDLFTRAGD